jgi:hypothetical protein
MDDANTIQVHLLEHGQCSVRIRDAEASQVDIILRTNEVLSILARECDSKEFASVLSDLLNKTPVSVQVRNLRQAAYALAVVRMQ